ncbi:MAG TPA: hypothetical protein VFF27_00420, partial [Bacteroidia bacterium]|nr:hypothetical protein [Bacteroidia bacterium]
KTTFYLAGAVYENDVLQFFGHEEGRIRFKPANGAIPASFQYDYFLKDHLGNVRMVLTEEQKQDKYPVASLEDAKVAIEDDYYTIDNTKIVSANSLTIPPPTYTNDNGIGNNPSDASFEQANSQKLYRVNKNTNKTGLGITLKVMAGDKIDIHGKSYWFDSNTGGSDVNVAPAVIELLTGFMGAPGGAVAGGHTTATELNGITSVTNPVNSFAGDPGRDNPTYSQRPKAFINYLFFDEQFKYVSGGFSAVNNTPGLKNHFSELQNLAAQKNGYVYIYVSNESPVNVFFDNLQVVHTRSPILEETHYYPFGLTMAGISSKALNFGSPENKKKKFQGQELNDDLAVNVYEFKYRMDDYQIGRFWQIDPLAEDYEYNSTYAFSENKVTSHIELEGLESFSMHFIHDATPEQKKDITPQTIAQTNNQGLDKGMPVVVLAWTGYTGLMAPTVVAPLVASYLFGVPSPGAPTSMVSTVTSEANTVVNEVKTATQEVKVAVQEVKVNPYSNLKDSKTVGVGKDFTRAQKQAIINTNKANNGGVIKSDQSGKVADAAVQSKKGVPSNMNQAEVDHIVPKAKGGTNSSSNAQVLTKEENLKKGSN